MKSLFDKGIDHIIKLDEKDGAYTAQKTNADRDINKGKGKGIKNTYIKKLSRAKTHCG